MSRDLMRARVESMVINTLASTYPDVPVRVANVPFTQPQGPFVVVTLMSGDSFRANIGSKSRYTVRNVHLIQVDVLVPEGTGTKLANEIAEAIGTALQEQDFSLPDGDRVITRVPAYMDLGNTAGFHRIEMRVRATRDAKF